MTAQPRVSIVTISFNQAQFVERAILSVLEQDYPHIEYIVVDPGSTDGSREIIDKYRDRIARIIFESDDGPADGLNKGFVKASGEIYGFLNSDDALLPGAISAAAKYLVDHPDTDVVSGHCMVTDQHDKPLRKCYSTNVSLNGYAHGVTILMQPSTFFRKTSFQEAGGFNSENRSNWDGELFIDMAICGNKFSKVDEFWSAFRLHEQSITASKRLDGLVRLQGQRMFHKIKGRRKTLVDEIVTQILRTVRNITYPRATYERLIYGPMYGGPRKTEIGRRWRTKGRNGHR